MGLNSPPSDYITEPNKQLTSSLILRLLFTHRKIRTFDNIPIPYVVLVTIALCICNVYVMRKVRIRTIQGFFCANLGFELCAIILGSRTQTSDPRILLRKPRIRTQSSRIAQPNLGHPRQQTHDRSRTQTCAIDCGFDDANGRAALCAQSIVGLLPQMAEVWLRDPRRSAKSSDGPNPYFALNIYTRRLYVVAMKNIIYIINAKWRKMRTQKPSLARFPTLKASHNMTQALRRITSHFIVHVHNIDVTQRNT